MKEFLRKTNSQDNNKLQLTKRIYQLNELKPTIIIFYLKMLLFFEVGGEKQKREIKKKDSNSSVWLPWKKRKVQKLFSLRDNSKKKKWNPHK